MSKPDYSTELQQWLKETGIKSGDKVCLVADPNEWRRQWTTSGLLNDAVGSMGVITELHGNIAVNVTESPAVRCFINGIGPRHIPFWCLIKVEDEG